MMMTVAPGALTALDSTAKVATGTRHVDENGNEYIYMLGVTNCVAGSWVKITLASDAFVAAMLDETAAALGGMCAVALAATTGSYYGWFQVYGKAEASFLVSCATNVTLFATTTAGSLDSSGTTRIHGVWLEDTEPGTATANLTCFLSYPHCNKVA